MIYYNMEKQEQMTKKEFMKFARLQGHDARYSGKQRKFFLYKDGEPVLNSVISEKWAVCEDSIEMPIYKEDIIFPEIPKEEITAVIATEPFLIPSVAPVSPIVPVELDKKRSLIMRIRDIVCKWWQYFIFKK